jgi:hypothetical protein
MRYRTHLRYAAAWLVLLAFAGPPAVGEVIFSVETGAGEDTMFLAGDITQFGVVSRVQATGAEAIGGVVCDVLLPPDWLLLDRDYGTHGWVHDLFPWDNCDPIPGVDPLGIPVTDLDPWAYTVVDPDFHFETVRADFTDLSGPGDYLLETLRIGIPPGTPYGIYEITFGYLEAAGINGLPDLDESSTIFYVVFGIPEPSTWGLFGIGALLVLLARRRRPTR